MKQCRWRHAEWNNLDKDKYHVIVYMWNLKKKKKQDTNELICKPEKSLSLLNVYNQETI